MHVVHLPRPYSSFHFPIRLLPVSFARHYLRSPLLMETTSPNPPWRGRGRGRARGRSFFRRGAAMTARARLAPATPSTSTLSSSTPIESPIVTPPSTENTALSNVRFADFVARGRLSSDLLEKLLPFEYCTEVQAATFDTILDGKDV